MNQLLANPIVTTGLPRWSTNPRRKVQTVVLFRNFAGAGVYSSINSQFKLTNPSTRLYVVVFFGFVPDTAEDAVIPVGTTVSMDAWGVTESDGPTGGKPVRGNSIIPGPFALPNGFPLSYEAITGVEQWRGSVTVPAVGTGIASTGSIVASASWEPAPGDNIPDEQLRKLFESCRLTPGSTGAPTVTETGIP